MTPTEQYNQELYHYGVKGMKWGVRRAIKKRDAIIRKHDRYVDKYQNAKAKGKAAKAAKYEGKAWKERAKFELAQQKINKLDPERIKKAQDFVNSLNKSSETSSSTSVSNKNSTLTKNQDALKKAGIDPYWAPEGKIRLKQTTNKTPYHALDDAGRAAVDADYETKRAKALKQFKSAKTEDEKQKFGDEYDDLEREYQIIVERDW